MEAMASRAAKKRSVPELAAALSSYSGVMMSSELLITKSIMRWSPDIKTDCNAMDSWGTTWQMTLPTICLESIIMMYASSALSYWNEEDVGALRVRAAVARKTHWGDLKEGSSAHISHLVLALVPRPKSGPPLISVSPLFHGDLKLVKIYPS